MSLFAGMNASEVNAAISAERHRLGATSTGMVLTFVIITDELHQSEATRAATFSANQHPCRIIVVIPRPARGKPQLDAEVWVGDREGPGETVKLRLKGPLAHQQASVVLPLLLPDTPVVIGGLPTPPIYRRMIRSDGWQIAGSPMRHSHVSPSLNSPCVSRITTPGDTDLPGLAPLPGGRSGYRARRAV